MIELKSLRHFVAVAEAGGFRKASALSGVRQSVLSRKVRDLEERLGVSVFERHREGVRLTNAGRRLLDDTRGVFAQIDRATSALQAAGSAGEGHLRLGFACSVSGGYLRELIRSWRGHHPHVALTLRDGSLHELIAAVGQRELDATVTTGAAVPPGCDMEQLWVDRIFLAVASSSPISARPSVSLGEVAGETFIVNHSNFGVEIRDFLIKNLSDLGVSPSVQIFDVGREMLFTMVGHGFGCTTAATVETGTSYAGVTYVPIRDFRLPFNVVWSPRNDNPALRRFLSEARMLSRSWPDDPPPATDQRLHD
jgi:DNA-binding transcriptional LysR family regulator